MATIATIILRHRTLRIGAILSSSSTSSCSFFSHSTTGADPDAASQQEKTCEVSSPPPIRVSLTEDYGRGVFASRPISAGDLIHTASPVVAHPSPSLVNKDFLEKEDKLSSSAFDRHCIERGLKYPFLVKRLACMVVAGKMSPDALDILQPANLYPDMISEMEEEFELLKKAFLETDVEDSLISFLRKPWYIGLLARIRINSFRVETVGASYEDLFELASSSVMADSGVGNALYMLPSFYNHDCDPNAHILWIDNADAKMKALRDIKTGEELRICYIDASMDREARQSILYHGFGFRCRCPRCLAGD